MYANIDSFDKQLNLYAEEEDLCYLCKNIEICPLLAAVQGEAVVLRYAHIEINRCGMYEEYTLSEMIAF